MHASDPAEHFGLKQANTGRTYAIQDIVTSAQEVHAELNRGGIQNQLIKATLAILQHPEARELAASDNVERWISYVGGTFGSTHNGLLMALKSQYGTFKAFAVQNQGRIGPTPRSLGLSFSVCAQAKVAQAFADRPYF